MKPVGNFNKLPKTFKQPERLKPGKTVKYRFTDDYTSMVIDRRDGVPQKKWHETIQIPPLDTIWLEYKDEKGEDQTGRFDIGLVKSINKNGEPEYEGVFINANLGQGEFILTGGNALDEDLAIYCELCNYNIHNPNRDTSKKGMFFKVDTEGEAAKKNKQVDMELEALIFIRNQTPSQIKKLAAAFQLSESLTVEELKAKLNEFARSDAEGFHKLATSKDVEVKATIQRAFIAGVIKYVVQQNKIVWGANNSTIATMTRVEGAIWQDQFADWIKTHKNGGATYENIVKLLEA